MSAKRYGASVSIYIDGNGGESDCNVSCDLSQDDEYRCPFAVGYEMPLPPGARCHFRDFSRCPRHAARLAALESARRILAREIKAEKERGEE